MQRWQDTWPSSSSSLKGAFCVFCKITMFAFFVLDFTLHCVWWIFIRLCWFQFVQYHLGGSLSSNLKTNSYPTNRFREKPSLKLISDLYLININGWYDWWRPVVHQLIQLNMQPDAAALHAFISEPRIDKGAAFSFISDTCRWYKSTMSCSVHRRIVAGYILENADIVRCTFCASIHSLHHEFGVSDW